MKPRWQFNTLGVVIYLLVTCWLVLGSVIVLFDGDFGWRPVTGLLLGALALFGIGWGRIEGDL